MSEIRYFPLYENLLVVGATSELFLEMIPKLLPYVKKFTCIGRDEKILSEIHSHYPHHVEILSLDLLDNNVYPRIESLLENQEFDGLLQLQGYGLYGFFDSIDLKDHEKIIQLNLVSLMKILHLFIQKQKRPNKCKLILQAASLAGIVYCPFLASYAAAKSALIHLSKTLELENLEHFKFITLSPKSFGSHFALRASLGKYEKPEGKAYTEQVIKRFVQAVIHKKGDIYCSWADWFLAKLYFFVPKKLMYQIFKKIMLKRQS